MYNFAKKVAKPPQPPSPVPTPMYMPLMCIYSQFVGIDSTLSMNK